MIQCFSQTSWQSSSDKIRESRKRTNPDRGLREQDCPQSLQLPLFYILVADFWPESLLPFLTLLPQTEKCWAGGLPEHSKYPHTAACPVLNKQLLLSSFQKKPSVKQLPRSTSALQELRNYDCSEPMQPGLKRSIKRIHGDSTTSREILLSRIIWLNIYFSGPAGYPLAAYYPKVVLLNSQLTSAGQSASWPQGDTWKVNNICFTCKTAW